MGLLTSLKANYEYSAQITPYGGHVNAEIIYRDNDEKQKFYFRKLDLWHCAMHKSFGRTFAAAPREKDWIEAQEWVNKQLTLIEKYGTVIVTRPTYIKNV